MVLKGRLLHFNAIVLRELKAQLQKDKIDIKIF